MRIRQLSGVAAICCGALLGAGCADDGPSAPPVPTIESPKGLVGLDPCALVAEEVRDTNGLAKGTPGQDELGANCRWSGSGSESLQLTAYTSGAGLTDLTDRVDPAATRVRLEGYPALEAFTAGGEFCRYDVGVADDEAIVATMDGGEPDSCTALQKLLTAVLSRLPASG